MLKWTLLAGLAVAAVVSFGSPAYAGGDHKEGGDKSEKHAEFKKKFMEKYDTNKDGVLSDEEKAKAKEDMEKKKAEKQKAKEEEAKKGS